MIMSSVARIKFIKTKVIFRYHTKGFSNQVSSNSDHEIKSYSCSNSTTKMGKNEKVGENILGYKTGQSEDYKLGQVLEITNRGKRDYKQGQLQGFQIVAERLQIGAKRFHIGAEIKNRGERNFKTGQGLQIGAEQMPLTLFDIILI